jgi:hypothetical protein
MIGACLALALATAAPPAQASPAADGATTTKATAPDAVAAPADPLFDGKAAGSSVEAAFRAAEGRRGPLDGRWRLRDRDGTPLYDFLLDDPGSADADRSTDPAHPDVEGAWRDLRRAGAVGDAGVLGEVRHDRDRLLIRFQATGGWIDLTLHPIAGGAWAGDLSEGGVTVFVFLDRL